MAEQNSGDQPAPGAEQRLAQERDQLREQVADLQAKVKAQGVEVHAREWLTGRGITEPTHRSQWVQAMAPSFTNLQFESVDEIAGLLDVQFGAIVPNATAPPADAPAGTEAPPSTSVPVEGAPPAPKIANPTPGGGQPFHPEVQPLVPGSDEWKQLERTHGRGSKQFMTALQQMQAQGRPIAWTPTDGTYPMTQTTRTTG